MKIHDRDQFLKLPKGTVYCKGRPYAFGDITIKHESLENDWYEQTFNWIDAESSTEAFDRLYEMHDNGASYPMQDSVTRDGCFDDKEMFLVFEKEDVIKLISYFQEALKTGYKEGKS